MSLFCLLILISAVTAREARHNQMDRTTEDAIKQFDSERPNVKLGKGVNMGSGGPHSAESLQSKVAAQIGINYVGVAVNIQNYSPFLLTDVKKHVIYGWEVI